MADDEAPKIEERRIKAEPLTIENFAPYGQVVQALVQGEEANQNTARRFNFLAKAQNLRPNATANICVFKCKPTPFNPFPIKLLEKHPLSTQVSFFNWKILV